MIFLVNRTGKVSAITANWIAGLTQYEVEELYRCCAWCPHWLEADHIARKRRRALELLRLK